MNTLGCHLDEWISCKGLLNGSLKGYFAKLAIIPSVSLLAFHYMYCHERVRRVTDLFSRLSKITESIPGNWLF